MNEMQKKFLLKMHEKNQELREGNHGKFVSLPNSVIPNFDVDNDLHSLIEKGLVKTINDNSDIIEITEEGENYVKEVILKEE